MRWIDIVEAEVFDLAKYKRKLPYVADFVILDENDPELKTAWGKLFQIWNNWKDPEYNEVWQYMGTELKEDQWSHSFRHRAHRHNSKVKPRRIYENIVASKGWKPTYEDILRGKGMMDNMRDAVAQLAKDHPELKAQVAARPTTPMKPRLVVDNE